MPCWFLGTPSNRVPYHRMDSAQNRIAIARDFHTSRLAAQGFIEIRRGRKRLAYGTRKIGVLPAETSSKNFSPAIPPARNRKRSAGS